MDKRKINYGDGEKHNYVSIKLQSEIKKIYNEMGCNISWGGCVCYGRKQLFIMKALRSWLLIYE